MAADNEQLRQVLAKQATEETVYYTASNSSYLQGTEIVQFRQLLNFTNLKIRANTSPVIALSGSSQGWLSTGDKLPFFDDTYAPNNLGRLIVKSVEAYSLGRNADLGATGASTYITFVASGSGGFIRSGSIRSSISALNTRDAFETFISHYAEQRDLGQINTYDNGEPFEESDSIEINPILAMKKSYDTLTVPTNLVQVSSSPASFDGVIEAQDIRRVVDRSSIDLPFIVRSPKGALSICDDNMKSYQFSDVYDMRQRITSLGSAPYLDTVGVFGSGNSLIDQPGAFSDAKENLSAFSDSAGMEIEYPSGSIDSQMRNLLISGINSGSVQYLTPDTNYFPTYLVAARHGFTFSQNDNYGYDSIAFGGLKK